MTLQSYDAYSVLTTLDFLKSNSSVLSALSDNELNAGLDAGSHKVCQIASWTADMGLADYTDVLFDDGSPTTECQMAVVKLLEFFLTDIIANTSPQMGGETDSSPNGSYSWNRLMGLPMNMIPQSVMFLIHKPWSHYLAQVGVVKSPVKMYPKHKPWSF